jgi:hypothetical protein
VEAEGIECLDSGSRESERSRRAVEPRAGRSAVEASRRGGLVRVGGEMRSRHSVEPASYELDLSRVLEWVVLCRGLVVLVFIIVECGYPYSIGTDIIYDRGSSFFQENKQRSC